MRAIVLAALAALALGGSRRAGAAIPSAEVTGGRIEGVVVDGIASFRTLADREHRALAGLSMGAMQAFGIGLERLDVFSHIGAFSLSPIGTFDAATYHGGVFRDAAAFNAKVRLLWIGAGTAEERFAAFPRDMDRSLTAAGIRHVLFESQGTSHEWQTWRRSLHDFSPRLFRE